jgi:hypothetical protein
MAEKPQRIDVNLFRLALTSSGTPPITFRVFREGKLTATLISSVQTASIDIPVASGDHPFIEVLDRNDDEEQVAFSGRLLLHWQAVANAASYRLEENVAAVWTLRREMVDDGSGAYTWKTRWLEDLTTHQFRIIPVDAAGNQGTALSFSVLMSRHPDVPQVGYAFVPGTGKVTINQA